MGRMLNLSVMAIAALAIGVPLAVVFDAPPPPPDLTALQAIAETSCKCARLKPDAAGKAECWQPFETRSWQIGKFERDRTIGACAGAIALRRCLPSTESCIITGYYIYPGPFYRQDAFCSAEEAAEAENVFDGPGDNWDAAIRAKQQEFMHGRRVAAAEGFRACGA